MWGKEGIPVIDLFAGMGGLGVGASAAGADVRLSVEMDHKACETLRANAGYHGAVEEADVRAVTGKQLRKKAGLSSRDPLIMVGGAPCQPFSKAAYWTETGDDAAFRRARSRGEVAVRPGKPTEARPDDRRSLVMEFWRLIEESKADGFVFENVPSIKHPRNQPIFQEFMQHAVSAGFKVAELKRNAAEHGVAQTRERVFILGSKARQPTVPQPTHFLQGQAPNGLTATVTAGEALSALTHSSEDEPEIEISGRWAQHLADVPPGSNYKAHTAWAGHPSPTFETETRFWNFLLKLSPDRPSWTLAANPGPWTGPFHWDSRRLKTSEMAALQGFPEGFKISGSRRERVRQVGNAVPPPLARDMVASVMRSLAR
jgi:DNA (cytosine-5)-methyltransferase 1